MAQDIVFALRLFRRQLGLVTLTIAGLALAIAISTVALSMANAFLYRGRGIADPATMFQVRVENARWPPTPGRVESGPSRGTLPFAVYAALAESAPSLDVVASFEDGPIVRGGRSRRIAAVTGNFFHVLGGRMMSGRPLTPADDLPGAPAVAVVGHAFWKNVLGADPGIQGSSLWLDDMAVTVVGVADRTFLGAPSQWNVEEPPALWIPMSAHADLWRASRGRRAEAIQQQIVALAGAAGQAQRERATRLETVLKNMPVRWNPPVDVFGRLEPGATIAQAEAEAHAIAMPFIQEPASRGPQDKPAITGLAPMVAPVDDDRLAVSAVIGTLVVLVVLLACANAANLLLASATARGREISTRLALGATRGRVVRQLLTESLMLGGAGGVLGLLLAHWFIPVLAAFVEVSPLVDVTPDGTVYGSVLVLTMAVGITAGLAPARYGRRGDLVGSLRSDQVAASTPIPARRMRALLVGGQAAMSLLLIVVAALCARSAARVAGYDTGFDVDRLLNVSVTFGPGHSDATRAAFWLEAQERLRQIPGSGRVSRAGIAPYSGFRAIDDRTSVEVMRNDITAEYFETLGIPVLQGRAFTDEEVRLQRPVAVISANLARQFWGEVSPIGAGLERIWGEPDDTTTQTVFRKPTGTVIVGVVADTVTSVRRPTLGTIFLPLSAAAAQARLVIRALNEPARLVPAVTEALRSLDRTATIEARPAGDRWQSERETPRKLAFLAAVMGMSALGLAAFGLFGVTAFVAGRRRHEISLRLVLGATRRDVTALLLRDSLRPVAIGLAVGLIAALLGGRVIEAALYGISGRDPMAITVAIAVLLVAAVVAAMVPVRAATNVEPAQVLRQL